MSIDLKFIKHLGGKQRKNSNFFSTVAEISETRGKREFKNKTDQLRMLVSPQLFQLQLWSLMLMWVRAVFPRLGGCCSCWMEAGWRPQPDKSTAPPLCKNTNQSFSEPIRWILDLCNIQKNFIFI